MKRRFTYTLIMIFFTAFFIISDPVLGSIDKGREKVVICIEVKKGDTLWGLAKQ